MKKSSLYVLRKMNVSFFGGFLAVALLVATTTVSYAATTSRFTQVINPGTLSIDIVDDNLQSVVNPSVALADVPFSFECQQTSGTFGTNTEQIYVQNPFGANSGWTVTIAAADPLDQWSGTDSNGDPVFYDFNDTTGSGCDDGGDSDSVGGQMIVDPSAGTIDTGICQNCTVSEISLGSQTSFEEGATDSITLFSGSAASDDVGDWTLQGVNIQQSIPSEQAASADYGIDMVVSVQAV